MKHRSCEYKVGDTVVLATNRDIVFEITRVGALEKHRTYGIVVIKGTEYIRAGNTYTVYAHEITQRKCMFADRMDGLDIGGRHGNS